MNKTVELSRYKVMYGKLKVSLDSKSSEIKRLQRIIRNYENRNTNTTEERDVETTITEDNESENSSPKVNRSITLNLSIAENG